MLYLGRFGGLECIVAGSKSAGTVERKEGAGESEGKREEEERQGIGKKV